MEMGYMHSPIAQIIKEYSIEKNEDNYSTYYQVQYYDNFNFSTDNILDLEFGQFSNRSCYSL